MSRLYDRNQRCLPLVCHRPIRTETFQQLCADPKRDKWTQTRRCRSLSYYSESQSAVLILTESSLTFCKARAASLLRDFKSHSEYENPTS